MNQEAPASPALAQRIATIEEAYEFMLAYAAQGRREEGGGPGPGIRDFLQRVDAALEGLAGAAADAARRLPVHRVSSSALIPKALASAPDTRPRAHRGGSVDVGRPPRRLRRKGLRSRWRGAEVPISGNRSCRWPQGSTGHRRAVGVERRCRFGRRSRDHDAEAVIGSIRRLSSEDHWVA